MIISRSGQSQFLKSVVATLGKTKVTHDRSGNMIELKHTSEGEYGPEVIYHGGVDGNASAGRVVAIDGDKVTIELGADPTSPRITVPSDQVTVSAPSAPKSPHTNVAIKVRAAGFQRIAQAPPVSQAIAPKAKDQAKMMGDGAGKLKDKADNAAAAANAVQNGGDPGTFPAALNDLATTGKQVATDVGNAAVPVAAESDAAKQDAATNTAEDVDQQMQQVGPPQE